MIAKLEAELEATDAARVEDFCLHLLLSRGIVTLPLVVFLYSCCLSAAFIRTFWKSLRKFDFHHLEVTYQDKIETLNCFHFKLMTHFMAHCFWSEFRARCFAVLVSIPLRITVHLFVFGGILLSIVFPVAAVVVPVYYLFIHEYTWSLPHPLTAWGAERDHCVAYCLYNQPRTLFQYVFGRFPVNEITHCYTHACH